MHSNRANQAAQRGKILDQRHCLQKGPYFKDLVLNKDLFWIFGSLMGPYLYFRVLIFTFLASFTQRMSIQSACIPHGTRTCIKRKKKYYGKIFYFCAGFQKMKIRPLKGFEKMHFLCFYIIWV